VPAITENALVCAAGHFVSAAVTLKHFDCPVCLGFVFETPLVSASHCANLGLGAWFSLLPFFSHTRHSV
jgi:hypothetical protein